jgi:predicted small lipoprotein YifL
MKRIVFVFLMAVIILSFALAGCGGKSDDPTPAAAVPQVAAAAAEVETPAATEAPEAEKSESKVETEFPLLPDAKNVMDIQGAINYQSGVSMADSFDFYMKEFTAMGLTEKTILTLNQETVWQLVFTGNENGKSLIVQTTKLDDATINVNIRYE